MFEDTSAIQQRLVETRQSLIRRRGRFRRAVAAIAAAAPSSSSTTAKATTKRNNKGKAGENKGQSVEKCTCGKAPKLVKRSGGGGVVRWGFVKG